MRYQWRDTARKAGNAQRIGEELERIRIENDGKLYPRDVAVAARHPKSPMHSCFEWNDTAAAQKYRDYQAADLITCIVAVVAKGPDTPVRAFVSVTDRESDPCQYFTAFRVAMRDPETRDQIIAKALSELNSWRRRYGDYKELAAAIAAVDEVLESEIVQHKAEPAGAAA